jgi:hypothetical protein
MGSAAEFQGNLWNDYSLGAVLEMTGQKSDFASDGKESFNATAQRTAWAVELGLRLLQSEWVKRKSAEAWAESPFPPTWGRAQLGGPMAARLPEQVVFAAPCVITRKLGQRLSSHWKQLLLAVEDVSLEVPITRFSDSYGRGKSGDRLVDYWIALESMFLYGQSRADMAERSALAISNYIGSSQQERADIRAEILGSYGHRSDVVHGDRGTDQAELKRATQRTAAILRRCLLKRVSELGSSSNK